MKDLTIVYYTASRIAKKGADKVRQHLLETTKGEIPIISVSQEPLDFGKNICVGDIGQWKYNIWKQALIGTKEVKTKYVACCEDDTLYNYEHFTYRPIDGRFAYDCNIWFCDPTIFWRRPLIDGLKYVDGSPCPSYSNRSGMFGFISRTEDLIDALVPRFEEFPVRNENPRSASEPGFSDSRYYPKGAMKLEYFEGKKPLLVFRQENSLGKFRFKTFRGSYIDPSYQAKELEPFGEASAFLNDYWKLT